MNQLRLRSYGWEPCAGITLTLKPFSEMTWELRIRLAEASSRRMPSGVSLTSAGSSIISFVNVIVTRPIGLISEILALGGGGIGPSVFALSFLVSLS